MLELIVEIWSGPKGKAFRWSLWQDGSRIAMCEQPRDRADDSEAEGRMFCVTRMQREPDRVTRL
jgi:hypothetical protein